VDILLSHVEKETSTEIFAKLETMLSFFFIRTTRPRSNNIFMNDFISKSLLYFST
jgi:hypothetical protein